MHSNGLGALGEDAISTSVEQYPADHTFEASDC
jgi:hypothetical protein